jgi:hypothetical protein
MISSGIIVCAASFGGGALAAHFAGRNLNSLDDIVIPRTAAEIS